MRSRCLFLFALLAGMGALSGTSAIRAEEPYLGLAACFGRKFDAYEGVLGKPAKVENRGKSEVRVYSHRGGVGIQLMYFHMAFDQPATGHVDVVQFQFDPKETKSWKAALAQLGVSSDGVKLKKEEVGKDLKGPVYGWVLTGLAGYQGSAEWMPNSHGTGGWKVLKDRPYHYLTLGFNAKDAPSGASGAAFAAEMLAQAESPQFVPSGQ